MLTLTGSDTLANYEAALESITYTNTSEDPNTGNRTVTWVVNDGDLDSVGVTSTITIAAVNDDPVAVDDSDSTNEDTPLVITASDLALNDTDAEGDVLTVTSVGGAVNGTVSLVAGTSRPVR